ncbi:PREDICTED: uncharacterized protein LOC109160273 [Ipomoea nil]|uniref:uncharacterized protein LOC109160273 n=1 Tax=Ipomoea nil TaxID=35883 RepID=UPI000901C6AD|nr:PREDICTED: uncharacterized protein LOC109160273 [Ipomoea nil]XP_019164112.1 PREDICTED: uncharacterized protein LOC109160273 [Ipomoea nil]
MEMESGVDVDDLFLKLHPCMPTTTRIGIVGAGPSGLSAAYALIKLGYSNVAVLEKHHSAGGMCESIDIQGRTYDLGGQVLAANSAPTIFHLAKEVGAEIEEMDTHKLALVDSDWAYTDMRVAEDYISVIPITLKLQDEVKATNRIGVYSVSEIASDVTPEFLKDKGLKSVPKSVAYGYTASGYGFIQDMPYAYIHEFIRTSMAGKIRRFKGGYTSVWKKLSEAMPIKFECNTEVLSIKRNSSGVCVDVRHRNGALQAMEFDKIIISGAFPFHNGRTYRSPSQKTAGLFCDKMDMSTLEKDLFSKVQTIEYYTSVLEIDGLEHLPMGFYYFENFMEDPAAIGNPVAMQKFYTDTNVFLFWSYGNSIDILGSEVMELAKKAVIKMGGQVKKVILQRHFKYFPHVNCQDMKDGFYEKLETQLQGQLNTYYVGGLMAFELTERNASYSMALIRKHFANDLVVPTFPYVKRLFPLKSSSEGLAFKQLDEIPGVKFPELSSLDSYLRHWGTLGVTENKTLYTWLNEKGDVLDRRTYKEVHTNAFTIAQKLLTSQKPAIKPGDKVLLIYVPGLDFVDAFFGCLRARVIPIPTIPPDPTQRGGGQALLHIANIAKVCNPVAILSTFSYHVTVRIMSAKNMLFGKSKDKSSNSWPDLPWLHTDSWVKKPKLFKKPKDEQGQPLSEDLCFLQFTSGSTTDPKGVMITHGGVIHNVKLMRKRYKSTSRTILVSWLPQYHDMGLIGGLLTILVSGGSGILFSPVTFMKNPLLWLQTMSKWRATHSAAPNFAFELLVRRLESSKEENFDLSSMHFLMSAAEPIRQTTLKRFVELTQSFGLSREVMAPGYGLAENCVFVSCAYGEGLPVFVDWQGRVCCGYIKQPNTDGVDIKIISPETGKENDDPGKEGEIWISSLSAGIGYWGLEELSQKTFENDILSTPGKRYIRTGDLGRIIDSKLFITGRTKDLIIVAGKNIYTSDIEKTVESSSELVRPGCCAVVGIPEDVLVSKGILTQRASDELGLVVIAEVRDGKPLPYDVMDHICTRVAEEHGVPIASIVAIKPRSISKTTSGKIKRYECAKRFISGTLDVIEEQMNGERSLPRNDGIIVPANGKISKTDIVNFLKDLLSQQTGIPVSKISTGETLVSYGVNSIGVVRAAQKISSFFGINIGAIDIFSATCIDDLADFVESLLEKNHPMLTNSSETKISSSGIPSVVSTFDKITIWLIHLVALAYVSLLLIIPAYISVSMFKPLILANQSPWFFYFISLACAPFSWMLCIFLTCICTRLLGNALLQPNYVLNPEISVWSVEFVKWWALYKAQEISSKVLAVHLRGTVFLNYWFKILGAKIASSALIDTVDITDPLLVSIDEESVISEGALIQSHEVKNGVLSFSVVRIGKRSSIGPYAVLQKGSIVGDGAEVLAQNKKAAAKISKPLNGHKGKVTRRIRKRNHGNHNSVFQLFGIYMIGYLNSLSAAIAYLVWIWLLQKPPSLHHFLFICIAGAFHWFPYIIITFTAMFTSLPVSTLSFAGMVAAGYTAHGLILSVFTFMLNHFVSRKGDTDKMTREKWILHRMNVACHIRFAKLLSGTELFCVYLHWMGAKIGQHCSIRAINPVVEPGLVSVADGVHLGDFSRIVPGYHTTGGYISGRIDIRENSVIGSQGLILPGSFIEKDVILGALSVAPLNSVLECCGTFVGSENLVMVRNQTLPLDDRIEEMDPKYKKVLGSLAANLAASTLKLKSRYFHRIGAAGKGSLRLYNVLPGLPDHKIFGPGATYPVIIRHSNCLSSDDDARLDPRGAAIRILPHERTTTTTTTPLLDLTLKTGKAFHARTIGDFATWLVCGAAAREEHVKHAPHIRDAMWGSLRRPNSYTELHYYSNICRLFRFKDGQEMYVRFKLRPFDEKIGEEYGEVEPRGILPPETGAIPRDENDKRPLLFLAEDFKFRVSSPDKVRYVLQLQIQPIPDDERVRETLLDCTKPWDEKEVPYIEVGEITIDQVLTEKESEELEFNPFFRCNEIDVIRATSCNQSASIDHGRSLVYEICQYLRNRKPLPEAWRIFLDQSDVKLDLSGCPLAAKLENKDMPKATLARQWYVTLWLMSGQPFLQIVLPYFLLGLVIYAPLNCLFYTHEMTQIQKQWLLPLWWGGSGILAGLVCALSKWVLVGKKYKGKTEPIWSRGIFMDTIWQAIRTVTGEYFMETATGTFLMGIWMRLMGSEVARDGVYIDSMGATLNPDMVRIEEYGSVGREALLFGHIYEGGGEVKYGRISVKNGGFVGSRAVAMPGATIDSGGSLGALSLAMKEEIIK